MNTIEKEIITLLKSAVTGSKLALPQAFDMAQILPKIKAHHMSSLVYEGAVNCGVDPQNPAMQQLFHNYCKALQVNERQMRQLECVFAAFEEKKIDYLPLKGCIMKGLYPRPELRMMGDADVLIRLEQYDRIVPVMQELGFNSRAGADHHFVWESDSLCLELHKSLLEPDQVREYEYFQDAWACAKPVEGTRYEMDEESTFAFLFAHFTRHFASSGIGCRHVVDLWVYLRSHPDMDEVYLRTLLANLNLRPFYQNIRQLIAVWFEDAEMDEKSELLSDVIFSNGSWGNGINRTLSRGVRDAGETGSAAKGRLKYIARYLSPGKEYFLNRYPVLNRHPWLFPAMWCLRLIQKLTTRSVLRKHGMRLKYLNRQDIQNRRQMLEYIGLMKENSPSSPAGSDVSKNKM